MIKLEAAARLIAADLGEARDAIISILPDSKPSILDGQARLSTKEGMKAVLVGIKHQGWELQDPKNVEGRHFVHKDHPGIRVFVRYDANKKGNVLITAE